MGVVAPFRWTRDSNHISPPSLLYDYYAALVDASGVGVDKGLRLIPAVGDSRGAACDAD